MAVVEKKRAAIHTLGCRLNQSETALLAEQLAAAGYEVVPWGAEAELGIVHTCTVTREADTKSRKMVRQFIRKNPDSYTAVIGCYAQMGADALSRIEGVDLIVGNEEKLNLLDYVTEGKNGVPRIVRDKLERDDFVLPDTALAAPLTHRANLKIQDGCDFMCSFCIIPFARGRSRSRELPNLVAEARALLERGAKELVLTGVNIGTYCWEERTVLDVIEALTALPGIERIRISSIEPTTIPDTLFGWMRDPAHPLTPYLHIPLQAGSDAVLARMRRKYTSAAFRDFIHLAHERVPGIGIGTDIMVGFPGETEADFEESCGLLRESPLFYAHVFKYSERPGAASVRMDGQVPAPECNRRGAVLRSLSAEKTRLFQEHHFGQTAEVLFEQEERGLWTGYTGNYLRVAVRSIENLENTLRQVRFEEARGELLLGQIVD